MYKFCTTEESVQRQRQLEACLLELMLTENYAGITVGDICDQAGLSRKSFYRYFSSKEGCLYALVDHAIFDGASFYLPGYNQGLSLQIIYEHFFRYWKEQHPLLDALTRNNLSLLLVERMLEHTIKEEQEFRFSMPVSAVDAHERNLFYVGGVMTLVLDWHRSGYQKSILQMARGLAELIG